MEYPYTGNSHCIPVLIPISNWYDHFLEVSRWMDQRGLSAPLIWNYAVMLLNSGSYRSVVGNIEQDFLNHDEYLIHSVMDIVQSTAEWLNSQLHQHGFDHHQVVEVFPIGDTLGMVIRKVL